MNLLQSIFLGYVRHALTLCAGYLLAHGLIDQAGGQVLAAAGVALAGVAWSTVQKFAAHYELRLAKSGVLPAPRTGPATKG
jgi:hypothetical protein